MELLEYRLCEKFGWTPTELDHIPAQTISKFLQIMKLEAQLQNGNP